MASNSQDSQLLAMVLLENAQLSPDTLQGAKLQLVQQAQQRTNVSRSNATEVAKKYSSKCSEMLETLQSLQQNGNEDDDDTRFSGYTVSSIQRETLLAGISAVKETFEPSLGIHEPLALQDLPSPIFLEDAVLVLQTLTCPTKAPSKGQPSSSHMVPSLFSNQLPAVQHHIPGSIPETRAENSNQMTSLKKRTRCHACHRFGHWKGDISCPSSKRSKNSGNAEHPAQRVKYPHVDEQDALHSNRTSGFEQSPTSVPG